MPLLFVHGFPLNHSMWQPQIDAFTKKNRVIVPDLRGFGESTVTAGTVTMEDMADDLHGILHAAMVDRPVVYCGLSMGGYIAWQFFRKYRAQLARPHPVRHAGDCRHARRRRRAAQAGRDRDGARRLAPPKPCCPS